MGLPTFLLRDAMMRYALHVIVFCTEPGEIDNEKTKAKILNSWKAKFHCS